MTSTVHTTNTLDTARGMGFATDRGSLVEALITVGLAVPKRPAVSVLGGVLLCASEDHLTVSGTDHETMVSVRVPGTVQHPGTLVIDHAELTKLLGALVKGTRKRDADTLAVTVRTTDDGTPVVDLAGYTMPVTSYPTGDYPTIPDPAPTLAQVDRETFTEHMTRVRIAVGTDKTPMLTGVHLEITPGRVTMAGTDRFRLAIAPVAAVSIARTMPTASALVPARLVVPVVTRFTGDRVRIGLDNVTDPSLVSFTCSDITVTVRTLCGDFPAYQQLLPTTAAGTIQTNRATLLAATRRAAAVLDAKRDRQSRVAVTITPESLSVAPVMAEHADTVSTPGQPATVVGVTGTARLLFTPAYLIDALNSFTGDTVTLHTQTSPTRPVLLTDTPDGLTEDAAFRHLLMPRRLQEN